VISICCTGLVIIRWPKPLKSSNNYGRLGESDIGGGLRHQGYNGTERIAGGRALCDQPSSIPSRGKRLRIQPVGVGPSPFDVGHCAFFRGQGGQLLRYQALITVARRNGATPGQIALARCLRSGGEIAIPKASTVTHVMENAGTAAINLTIKG